jgi:protein-tyrosine phosphatase
MFTMRPGRPDVSWILPALLVGGYPHPHDVPWLAEAHGVGAVLSLQDDADLAAKGLDAAALDAAYRAAGLVFARLPVPDGDEERMVRVLPEAVARVAAFRAAGHVVYVHCNAGMNRAPTVAIGFVHVHEGRALAAAVRLVKARRPCLPFQGALARVYGARALRPPTR